MSEFSQPVLLLIEDNEDDVFLMRRAMRAAAINLPLHVASDGEQAIAYLAGTGQYADRELHPVPALVFLDLKLPYKDGFEVLAWIRANPFYKDLPVIVLTSSPEERDRRRAAALGANHYCVKPPNGEMLQEIVQSELDVPNAS